MPERPTDLKITVEPIDPRRCKFILNRPVMESGRVRKYTSAERADSRVAEAVLSVPGVCEVVLSSNVVTAVADENASWDRLAPQVQYGIEAALSAAVPSGPASSASPLGDDDEMYETVAELFERQINPAVAQHGGKVELIDVQEGTVVLRMMGGCQGCGMANVTLRQGIETAIRRAVPGFAGLKDITDHAAGTNPYFQAATK